MINQFKSEIDSIPKSNDILITEKINALSQDLMKNYVTSSLFDLSMKKYEEQIKDMSERFLLIDEHLSSIRTKVSSLEEKLTSLSYTSKEDFDKLKKEYETLQKSISDCQLRSLNAFNGSSSNHSVYIRHQ